MYEKCKKHYYVVPGENESIFFTLFPCQVTLTGFLWLKIGPKGEVNHCIIMNNDQNSSKLADRNLHQQKLVKMCVNAHRHTIDYVSRKSVV